MRKFIWGSALSLLGAFVPAFSFADGYIGLNYTQLEQEDRFFGEGEFDTGEVFARLGGHVNRYFATELRLGSTLNDKSEGGEEYRFNYHVGAYVQLGYQFDFWRPYSLLGYTYGEEEATLNNNIRYDDATATIKDTSYGAGVDINIGENLGLNAEYVQYYDIGDVSFKGPSAGVFYKF